MMAGSGSTGNVRPFGASTAASLRGSRHRDSCSAAPSIDKPFRRHQLILHSRTRPKRAPLDKTPREQPPATPLVFTNDVTSSRWCRLKHQRLHLVRTQSPIVNPNLVEDTVEAIFVAFRRFWPIAVEIRLPEEQVTGADATTNCS